MSVIALLAVVSLVACVQADTLTWTGAAGDGKWSTPENWTSDGTHTVPQSGDSVYASADTEQTVNNDITGLVLPHLELNYRRIGKQTTANRQYVYFTGNKIKLTGGLNAFKATVSTKSGASPEGDYQTQNSIPFELDDAADGGTNQLWLAMRFNQQGNITGPGFAWWRMEGAYSALSESDQRTTGAYVTSTAYFDVNAANVLGDGTYVTEMANGSSIRTYSDLAARLHMRQSTTLGDTAARWEAYGNRTFNGKITGNRFVCYDYNANGVFTFAKDVEIDGPVHVFSDSGKTGVGMTFNGRLVCNELGRYDNGVTGRYTLNATGGAVKKLHVYTKGVAAGAPNCFGSCAVVDFGPCGASIGGLDLQGNDQAIDRIVLNDKYPIDAQHPVGHIVTSSKGPAALTLSATEDCETDALFSGGLSLVWNPQGDSAFQTYAAFGREMPMTGRVVVSNGTFTVNGANSFPHASAVEVADGATFVWDSNCDGFGLAGATRIVLGDDATFEVAEGRTVPFAASSTMPSCEIDLLSTSHLVLREDVTLTAKAIRVDGQPLADGVVYCGAQGVPGTTYLAALAGSVTKIRTQASPMRLSAKAYVSDGLVCLLDGIENAGYGVHDGTATVWKDLTGLSGDFAVSNCSSFTENALHKNKSGLMAWNTKQRKDIVTIESAISGLETATLGSGQCIMPVFFNTDQNIIIKRPSSTARRFSFDNKCFGWQTEELLPDSATVTALYVPLAKGTSFYLNAAVPEGERNTNETWSSGSAYMTIGGRHISWVGSDTAPSGYSVQAVRFYTRELSAAEVTNNWAIDCVRFRGYLPCDTIDVRRSAGGRAVSCRLTASASGGTVTFEGLDKEPGTDSCWPELGQTVTMTARPDSQHAFEGWVGDVDAIVGGTASEATITVLVDRPLALSVALHAAPFVVSCDTNLTENVFCSGITFLGPYTVTAADGVKLTLDEGGAGIVVADGVTGAATVCCPLVVGGTYGGERQTVTVPAGATLVLSGPLGGKTSLDFTGPGAAQFLGGGDHAGDLTFAAGDITFQGEMTSAEGAITYDNTLSKLTLSDARIAKKLVVRTGGGTAFSVTDGDTAIGGFDLAGNTYVSVAKGATLTISGDVWFRAYCYPSGEGTFVFTNVSLRTSAAFQPRSGTTIYVDYPGLPITSYFDINGKFYTRCENAMGLAQPRTYDGSVWDLCGYDQTCGRFSWISEYNADGSFKTLQTTQVIRSDAPATLTVHHDNHSGSGSNVGPQVYAGKIVGQVSLVKTGYNYGTVQDLTIASEIASTGSVEVSWGLLSFTNAFTYKSVNLPGGRWPNCTRATAGRQVAKGGDVHYGTLELLNSKALGKKTEVYVAKGGAKVRLGANVNQRVAALYFEDDAGNWVKQPLGSWGSSASLAENKDDERFEGPGRLLVGDWGSFVIVR